MYCPNQDCENHIRLFGSERWYRRSGSYFTKTFGEVRRYRCRSCGKTFSDQSFSIDYYAKKTVDYTALYWLVCSSVSMNAMGRELNVSFSTIANRLDRMRKNYWTGIPYGTEHPTEPETAA